MASPAGQCDDNPGISKVARKLAEWGYTLYCTGKSIAILLVGLAMIFAVFDTEPVYLRVASVVILGAIPALLVWGGAFVIYNLLRGASSLCDRTAKRFVFF